MDVHRRIHQHLIALVPDVLTLKPGAYVRLAAPGFMDLHVDVLRRERDGLVVSLAHNFLQNGDVMADPDMEVRLSTRPDAPLGEALTCQLDALGVYEEVYPTPGYVNPRLKRRLNAFLAAWLRRLHSQGHRIVERRCE